ncbi:MAG: hypothetical protein RMN25_04600 [Anaerolineae bacterium]|nr:hypothetical protein [Thermoflexales bacterium]MDW8407043.1 hypothetical protein [Anaerolineae bacterium]
MTRSAFYLPENPAYTILDSVHDSVRFARRCLIDYRGHRCAASSFVDPDGSPMMWHDFGPLEGPGWAANAVGGAFELYWYARVMGRPDVRDDALGILDHVLEDGFIDWSTGFIRPYRHIPDDRLCLNYKSNDDWFCPGSLARIGSQLLRFADVLPADDPRVPRMRRAAVALATWLDAHVQPLTSGWFPRRCSPDGAPYPFTPEGGHDPLFENSADPLFILELWEQLTVRRLANYRRRLRVLARRVVKRGGIFGSINHDTYDEHESVAYAVTFRLFRRLGALLCDDALIDFAYRVALNGLIRFEMKEDRNGVATRGLLWMERSWDTAYLWENAHAAQAYFEAYADTGRRLYLAKGLTILRAIAKHHHGPHGFLTEGVDWNNHVSAQHHVDYAEFGDIRYTEPLLNNLHIAEPTLFWLEQIALKMA